jgi:hypothetical protein
MSLDTVGVHQRYTRHTAAGRKKNMTSSSDLGCRRMTFHTTMLIDSILLGGGVHA